MKLFYHIRYLFQLLTVVSAFLVLGSLGARRAGAARPPRRSRTRGLNPRTCPPPGVIRRRGA